MKVSPSQKVTRQSIANAASSSKNNEASDLLRACLNTAQVSNEHNFEHLKTEVESFISHSLELKTELKEKEEKIAQLEQQNTKLKSKTEELEEKNTKDICRVKELTELTKKKSRDHERSLRDKGEEILQLRRDKTQLNETLIKSTCLLESKNHLIGSLKTKLKASNDECENLKRKIQKRNDDVERFYSNWKNEDESEKEKEANVGKEIALCEKTGATSSTSTSPSTTIAEY